MKHARPDYDRIQDPALADPSQLAPGCSPIAADEPVFLLRGNDRLAYHNVLDYAARADESGLQDVAASARSHAVRMQRWLEDHGGGKLPDLPPSPIRKAGPDRKG